MAITKPNRVQYAWKHADKRMDVFTKELLKWLDFDTDSNASLDGVQNPFDLNSVVFRADCPGVDVFAIGIAPGGGSYLPGFMQGGLNFTVKETGGIDASQTSFEILAPAKAVDIATGDHLETPSGECLRVEEVTTGSPNYTLTVERGAHGTDKAAVDYEGTLKLLTPKVGMKRIILQGDTSALDAPVMNTPQGQESAILLSWTHTYSDADLLRLKGWKIYYAKAAGIDLEDEETYEGFIDIEGIDTLTLFSPKTAAGLSDVNTTYYFAMVAITKSLLPSDLSNEVSGKAYGTIGPTDTPAAPVVSVDVNGSYRLKVEAKKPTGVNAALGVMNVKKATIEVYYADAGSGNPTDGTPDGDQTLIGSYDDTSSPYSVELGVSSYGLKDYWARAKFTDGNDAVSDWGLSSVFELNAQNNTTDSGVATGAYVRMLVDTGSLSQKTTYFANVIGTGEVDSASMCEIAFRVDGVGTFAAENDTPFTGATAVESVPKRYGGYPGIYHPSLSWAHTWEVTCRIYNNYGWGNWSTPQSITLTKSFDTTDSDVCDLAEFGAWTTANPHPDGWSADVPQPGPQQVTFTYKLPTSNASSVWAIGIEGTEDAAFPTETVAKSQADGVMVAVPGTYEATVSGFAATLNEYAGKFLRLGSATAKNATDASLQVFAISSNTAGNPFTITIAGTAPVMNLNPAGAVTYWQIITKPIWDLCDYFQAVDVFPEQLGALRASKGVFYGNAVDMKFRAYAHNVWGKGTRRESTTAAAGSATAGAATYKEIGGVDTADIKDGAITGAKVGATAISVDKTVRKLQPIAVDLAITCTDNNSWSWGSGHVQFPGRVNNINSGSKDGSNNLTYWGYIVPLEGTGGRTLTFTTSYETAVDGDNVCIAVVATTSDTGATCMAGVFGGIPLAIGKLSALTIDAGELTTGILTGLVIRTGSSGARIEMDKTNGFRNIDSSGTTRVQIPASSSKIILTSGYNATTGLPETGWIEFASNFHIVGGVGILPATAGSGNFLIGSSGGLHTYRAFNSIELVADNDLTLELRTTTALKAGVYLSTSGLTFLTNGNDLEIGLGLSGDLIIGGSGGNNIDLDGDGNLAIAGDLDLKDAINFVGGSNTSYIKVRDAGGTTRYFYSNSSGVWTMGTSAP